MGQVEIIGIQIPKGKGKEMNYYTINNDTGLILDIDYGQCPEPQKQADYFGCPIYIIKGEHAGLSADPLPKRQTVQDILESRKKGKGK